LRASIETVQKRLAGEVGEKAGGVLGYKDQSEKILKQHRLQKLQSQLKAAVAQKHPSATRGGGRLLKQLSGLHLAIHQLEEKWMTAKVAEEKSSLIEQLERKRTELETKQMEWNAKRMLIAADGEKDKNFGNETIRWSPEAGWLDLKLPQSLEFLANRPLGRYRLSTKVSFAYRGEDVAAQVMNGKLHYDIHWEATKNRWYLSASWSWGESAVPRIESLTSQGVIGVDLNAGYLAAWVLDGSGNPKGDPTDMQLELEDSSTTTRDGRLRQAVSDLVHQAEAVGVKAIAIEDLNFQDARQIGRETMGRGQRGKRFRRTVAGIPTGAFRDRLVQMCTNRGLHVIAVDPAYTSKWGEQWWQKGLQKETRPAIVVSRHNAASVVIGRRGLGLKARRRESVTVLNQRKRDRGLLTRPAKKTRSEGRARPRGKQASTKDLLGLKGQLVTPRLSKTVGGSPVSIQKHTA
jgi:IS605 OrfB family transposase